MLSTIHSSGDGEYASELGPVNMVTEDELDRIVDERISAPIEAGGGAELQVQCWLWDAECYGCCHGNVCCTYCRGIPGCY